MDLPFAPPLLSSLFASRICNCQLVPTLCYVFGVFELKVCSVPHSECRSADFVLFYES
jgi:hypothetical protein